MTYYRDTLDKAAKWASIEFDHTVTVGRLKDPSRSPSIAYPRFYVIAYMHATKRYSMPQIARALGLKNHTSVLHALRRAHGHDEKGKKLKVQPLWKKELFVSLARRDGFLPSPVTTVEYEDLIMIGESNLSRYADKFLDQRFTNELGWAA